MNIIVMVASLLLLYIQSEFGEREGIAVPLPKLVVTLAAHEKTGTVVSGQLVDVLKAYTNVVHNFYWSPSKGQNDDAIEFVRNPFAMVMSAYYYHRACTEAIFSRPALGDDGYIPAIRALVGKNISFCKKLQSLPRRAGLRLQYNFTLQYPYPELVASLKAGDPLLRICLGNWIRDTPGQLQRISRVLGYTKYQETRILAEIYRLKRKTQLHNPAHFSSYDKNYSADVRYLRQYDASQSGALLGLERRLGCII